jgi:hypothetical protein
MKKWIFSLSLFLIVLAYSVAGVADTKTVTATTAAGPQNAPENPFVVGAYMSMGMAHTILNLGDSPDQTDPKPRFAGAGGAYFDWYLMDLLAVEGGLAFIGKGFRAEEGDVKMWERIIYMEMPLGAKLAYMGFQASLTVGLEFALSGKTTAKEGGDKSSHKWDSEDWDLYRRFNLCPRITLGYAIPVGPIFIVPGLTWMIEVINDAKGDADDANMKIHNMNLMINAGAEWGFGG